MVELTVILPAYNEEENLKRIPQELIVELEKLRFKGKKVSYEILIIDDGSKDNTLKVARAISKKYGAKKHCTIKVIRHEGNKGLGQAVRTGIKNAKGELCVTLDSDFTFHPKLIRSLLKRYEKGDVDLVIGSPALAGYDKTVPLYRIMLSRLCNLGYCILLWKKLTAVSPIFRLYKSNALKRLELSATGFDINAEILVKMLQNRARIAEVPAKLTVRKYGQSNIDNLKAIKNHLKIYWKIIKWKTGISKG